MPDSATTPGVTRTSPALTHVASASMGEYIGFVPKEQFVVGNPAINFSYLSDNFSTLLENLNEETGSSPRVGAFRIELPISFTEANCTHGGASVSSLSMAVRYQLLLLQPKGESGILLVNGFENVSTIIDTCGRCWFVSLACHYGGWFCDAGLIESTKPRLLVARQFLSR